MELAHTRRRRVMQLTAEHYGFYQHVVPLAKAFEAAGFDVVCVGPPGIFDDRMRATGLRVLPIRFERSFNPAAHLASLWRLVRAMRAERIDVLHSHSALGGFLGRIAARLARVPLSVYTAHGFHFHARMRRPAFLFFWFVEWLGTRLGDFLLTQNEEDAGAAIRGRFAPRDRIAVVGNGVDVTVFDRGAVTDGTLERLRRELQIPDGAPVVITIGRPTRNKGVRDFFRIADRVIAAHETACFIAVLPSMPGEPGDVRAEIEQRPARPGVCVLGYRHDVRDLLALASVYVIPSLFEGLSKTVIEAMAMSLPVVGYDVRGVRDLIENGETGVLVPHGAWEGAADAVLQLLRDPERARAMGANARRRALAEHDERRVFQKQIDIIRGLIEERLPAHRADHR